MPTVAGLIAIVFVVSHIIPADPVALVAGETATEAQKAAVRAQYGFDKPLVVQLGNYYLNVLQGDLGKSLFTTRPVAEDLFARLPATIELTLASMLVTIVAGIPLGVLAALRRNSAFDHVVRLITVSGLAIASFWLGLMLQWLFAMELGGRRCAAASRASAAGITDRSPTTRCSPATSTGFLGAMAPGAADADARVPGACDRRPLYPRSVLETMESAAVQYQRSMESLGGDRLGTSCVAPSPRP